MWDLRFDTYSLFKLPGGDELWMVWREVVAA
jgi:hypothetical protein